VGILCFVGSDDRFSGRDSRRAQRWLWKVYVALAVGSFALGVRAVSDGRLLGSVGAVLSVTGWLILAVLFHRFSRRPVEPSPVGDNNGQP
jgi:hypothetical protein